MTEPPMKVGILGAGTVTSGSHMPVLVNMPEVQVVWICDRSAAAAQSVAGSYGVPHAYTDLAKCPDVDVVLVATPVGARPEVVPAVLARGWHAFCEKPFALSLAEHDAYLAEAARHGVRVGVGQVRRYGQATVTAREMLRQGFLGPVLRVGAAEGFRMRNTGRGSGWHMTDRKAGGGVLMETGSHLVDQVLHLLGAESVELLAVEQRVHRGLELATSLEADVVTEHGARVPCALSVSAFDDLCNGIFIEFERHLLKIDLFFDDTLALVTRDGRTLAEFRTRGGATTPQEAFYLEWHDFLGECRNGRPSVVGAASVRNTTALIEACYERADRDAAAVGAGRPSLSSRA